MSGNSGLEHVAGASLPKWLRSGAIAWAGALLAGLVVALAAGFLFHEWQSLEDSEVRDAELYARVLQDHAERSFNAIDLALGSLTDTVAAASEAGGPPARKTDLDLTHALNGLPFLRSLSLMTGQGRVIASSYPANVGATVDLEAVVLPAHGAPDALGGSVPGRDLVDAPPRSAGPAPAPAPSGSSRTFVPLVRQVDSGSAQPLYLVAVLNPDFFGNEYELALDTPTRAAGLFSVDGVMLAATGNLRKLPGESAATHPFFARFLPAHESGSFVGSGIDGDKVVTAFRVLRQRPLAVIVEAGYGRILAAFSQTLYRTVGVTVAALLAIAAMMVMGWRSLRGHEAVSAALESTRAEIAASERDLRLLVESVHELIFRADANGRIVFVNGRWEQFTRRPASEVLGKRLTDLCREDERQACQDILGAFGFRDENILVHVSDAAGGALTLDLSVSRVLDADGRTVGFAGFAVDVSARETAQQALESQLKFTAQLLEVSPTPIFVLDDAGRFVTANRAWLALMQLGLSEVVGRDAALLCRYGHARNHEDDTRRLHAEGRISYENQLCVAGQPPRDTVVTKVAFSRADGSAAGIVGSIIDVTEFRQAEREIRQARDAARLADSAKSEFMANISHELRTPLQAIIGFSELGRDLSGERPDFLEMFTDIHAGGLRMLTLVNGLLDVSQMNSAVGSLPLRRVDLAELVSEAVGSLRAKADAAELQVEVQGLDEIVEADADPVRFQQALRHVLANAVRHSPRGGRIDVRLRDQGPRGIELTVRDRGPGVPQAELELIFDAFVQSSRTKDGSGGAGLGLTIARKIMGAHGGSVVAANAEGGGALISLFLPAASGAGEGQAAFSRHGSDGLLLASEAH